MNKYIKEALNKRSGDSGQTQQPTAKLTQTTQIGALGLHGSSRLLDMRDCTRPEWARINLQLQTQQYRLQPPWFRPFLMLNLVRSKLGYNHPPRLWEYPWALLSANLGQGMRVLDIGSGGSAFPLLLSLYGCRIHAADPSLKGGRDLRLLNWRRRLIHSLGITSLWGLPFARRRGNHKVIYVSDPAQKLRYSDEYFDRVFCISVIEHIPIREWACCMAEMSRVLSIGGRLVLTLTMEIHQANERWHERLLVEPSLRLVGRVDYPTPISVDDAQTRHPGQNFETLGLVWDKMPIDNR